MSHGFDFEQAVRPPSTRLPSELRDAMSNVDIVVDEDAPASSNVLGLYQGIPLTRRGSSYGGVLPDKITIYRRPIERVAGHDHARLQEEIRHVVRARDRAPLRHLRRAADRDGPLLSGAASPPSWR